MVSSFSKSHCHVVMVVFSAVEVSVNWIVSGAIPEVTSISKFGLMIGSSKVEREPLIILLKGVKLKHSILPTMESISIMAIVPPVSVRGEAVYSPISLSGTSFRTSRSLKLKIWPGNLGGLSGNTSPKAEAGV